MQSTFPGADIGIKPYCVMVVHFQIRKNETFGRGCRESLFLTVNGTERVSACLVRML